MYHRQVDEINTDLAKTRKAIIAIGCSFVEGQGAVNQELIDNYDWTMEKTGIPMEPILSEQEKNKLLEKYKNLISWKDNKIDWTFMEYNNSFVNVLCKKYFEGKYTPINFGLRGRGNRASIKSLYFWPQINWKNIDETIVIYVPSGQERFDFLNDEFKEHAQFSCMWPHWKDQPDGPRQTLWKGYSEAVFSNKSAALEQISNVIELDNWCKLNNAKLIITPGFDKQYRKECMLASIKDVVSRDSDQKINFFMSSLEHSIDILYKRQGYTEEYLKYLEKIVDMWPYDNMFKPEDCETFIDLCLKQEGLQGKGFWDYNGIGTPNGWVTVCCHPSAKGHDLFAKRLFENISKL
jgi:hypothetical protein